MPNLSPEIRKPGDLRGVRRVEVAAGHDHPVCAVGLAGRRRDFKGLFVPGQRGYLLVPQKIGVQPVGILGEIRNDLAASRVSLRISREGETGQRGKACRRKEGERVVVTRPRAASGRRLVQNQRADSLL